MSQGSETPRCLNKNREKYRQCLKFDRRIVEFCPKFANFSRTQGSFSENSRKQQGISRDFLGSFREAAFEEFCWRGVSLRPPADTIRRPRTLPWLKRVVQLGLIPPATTAAPRRSCAHMRSAVPCARWHE